MTRSCFSLDMDTLDETKEAIRHGASTFFR